VENRSLTVAALDYRRRPIDRLASDLRQRLFALALLSGACSVRARSLVAYSMPSLARDISRWLPRWCVGLVWLPPPMVLTQPART